MSLTLKEAIEAQLQVEAQKAQREREKEQRRQEARRERVLRVRDTFMAKLEHRERVLTESDDWDVLEVNGSNGYVYQFVLNSPLVRGRVESCCWREAGDLSLVPTTDDERLWRSYHGATYSLHSTLAEACLAAGIVEDGNEPV